MRLSNSSKIFIGLVILLAALTAASVYFPTYQGLTPSPETLPPSKPLLALMSAAIVLAAYGALGFIGIKLSPKIGIPDLWSPEVTNKQRLVIPAVVGAVCGIIVILGDFVFSSLHSLGRLPHPEFPASITASLAAGIGEELIFRLFFITFWVWLIHKVILQGRFQVQVFWVVAVLSAVAFGAGHLPAVMVLFNFSSINEIHPMLLAEILLLNGVISIAAAYYFRKYGFLAAVSIHFWADIVWHVIWGLVS